jgi:hypothetical protein
MLSLFRPRLVPFYSVALAFVLAHSVMQLAQYAREYAPLTTLPIQTPRVEIDIPLNSYCVPGMRAAALARTKAARTRELVFVIAADVPAEPAQVRQHFGRIWSNSFVSRRNFLIEPAGAAQARMTPPDRWYLATGRTLSITANTLPRTLKLHTRLQHKFSVKLCPAGTF